MHFHSSCQTLICLSTYHQLHRHYMADKMEVVSVAARYKSVDFLLFHFPEKHKLQLDMILLSRVLYLQMSRLLFRYPTHVTHTNLVV